MTEVLMLPALSSISTAGEFDGVAAALPEMRCRTVDWPGFGGAVGAEAGRLDPAGLRAFLDGVLAGVAPGTIGVAAGHGATYLAEAAGRSGGRSGGALRGLVLVAPTWRGPLPTMFARRGGRPGVCRGVRRALELPVIGTGLYRLNMSAAVVGWMMREHVYSDPAFVTPAVMAAKRAVTRRASGRFGTAAFVTGGLDPVGSREAFLRMFEAAGLPPAVLLRPRGAPRRSGAEMDALAATGRVAVREMPGALAAHEEFPGVVAEVIRGLADGDGRRAGVAA